MDENLLAGAPYQVVRAIRDLVVKETDYWDGRDAMVECLETELDNRTTAVVLATLQTSLDTAVDVCLAQLHSAHVERGARWPLIKRAVEDRLRVLNEEWDKTYCS